MSSSCEQRFEFPETPFERTPGPLEKLWNSSSSFGTMFLSGDEVYRREQEARSIGVQETERRLRSEHKLELTRVREGAAEAIANFEHQRQDYFRTMEKEVVRLALAVARKVVGKELNADPALLAEAVRGILDRLDRGSEVRLHVSLSEKAAWEKALVGTRGFSSEAAVVADPSLSPGKCVIQTSVGSTVLDPISEVEELGGELLRMASSTMPAPEPSTVQ